MNLTEFLIKGLFEVAECTFCVNTDNNDNVIDYGVYKCEIKYLHEITHHMDLFNVIMFEPVGCDLRIILSKTVPTKKEADDLMIALTTSESV